MLKKIEEQLGVGDLRKAFHMPPEEFIKTYNPILKEYLNAA